MPTFHSGLLHLSGNLMAAVDLETTGRRAGYHEIIQIAIVPLDSEIRPLEGVKPFYSLVCPDHPDRQELASGFVHGLNINEIIINAPSPDRVQDYLIEWFNNLDLALERKLVPLAHNWAFESAFLKSWLGVDMFDRLFHPHARDSMLTAIHINDKAVFAGELPIFKRVSLGSMCRKLGVINLSPHDALSDAKAEAEVYRHLVYMDLF